MSLIALHINYLLRRHDCVVMPGIGAFVARHQSAVIDTAKGIMLPPKRIVGFNADINHDDGLIASSVSRQLQIPYDRATAKVNDEINALKFQLDNDREIAFPHLGILTKTENDLIEFEPFETNVVSVTTMALPAVKLTQLTTAAEPSRPTSDIVIPVSRNWLKIAASVIVLICLGTFLSTPVHLSDAQLASLSAPAITLAENDFPTEYEIAEIPRHASLNIAIPSREDGMATADTTSTAIEVASNRLRLDAADRYYLIVASLPTRALADKYIADAGASQLGILEKDGKFRVYAATGQTTAEALEPAQRPEFADKYPGAWVCRR
ncbi:MAG: hypothetical protein K2L49_02365 [Muribaculaceae bacterium]|nr:hypothetical protein [Muribaculaceae bacterium]